MPSVKWLETAKNVIKGVAPTLATALGGPVAGLAVSQIIKGLGTKTEDEALELLVTDPEAIVKLKEIEVGFKKFVEESGVRIQEIDVKDRESARQLAISKGMQPQVILSTAYTIGYFGLVFGLLTGGLVIPETGLELIVGVVGILTAAQGQILNFWFGSSSGSKAKTELMGANV